MSDYQKVDWCFECGENETKCICGEEASECPSGAGCSIASTMKSNNPKMEPFRSGGFINREYDMGRVYIDLPIAEAEKLINKLKK